MPDIISFCDNNGIKYKKDVSAKTISTFKIGGNIPLVLLPDNSKKVSLTVKYLSANGIKSTVVGNASNILFPDEELDKVVIKTDEINEITLNEMKIICGAGVQLGKAALFAQKNGLSGMEKLYGIPGTVGGAVVMNAGAYGAEMAQIVSETEYIDENGEIKHIFGAEHNFAYRHSFFQTCAGIVTKVTLSLAKGSAEKIKSEMDECMSKRRASQPLEYPSAGSVFRRPEGFFAGKLVEDAGFKGFSVGGAKVSEKHAGFIINYKNAESSDVKKLIKIIQEKVKEQFGVELETEIRFL